MDCSSTNSFQIIQPNKFGSHIHAQSAILGPNARALPWNPYRWYFHDGNYDPNYVGETYALVDYGERGVITGLGFREDNDKMVAIWMRSGKLK